MCAPLCLSLVISLLGWISLKPLEGVGKREEARKAEKEVRRPRERGGALPPHKDHLFVLSRGERVCAPWDAELLSWGSSPPPVQPSPHPPPPPRWGERIFSAIDEAGAKVPLTDRSLFVSGSMFFRLWRFYGNHKKTTPNVSPLPIALFVFAPRRWLSARGFWPGAAQRQPGFVATPPHPPFWFFPVTGGLGEGSCQGNRLLYLRLYLLNFQPMKFFPSYLGIRKTVI